MKAIRIITAALIASLAMISFVYAQDVGQKPEKQENTPQKQETAETRLLKDEILHLTRLLEIEKSKDQTQEAKLQACIDHKDLRQRMFFIDLEKQTRKDFVKFAKDFFTESAHYLGNNGCPIQQEFFAGLQQALN